MLLRRRAQEIVELAEKTTRELVCRKEAVSGEIEIVAGEGEISIGCGETQNMKPLSEMMAAFGRKYPEYSPDCGGASVGAQ